jgi:RNA polymerase sigma-70 factor (ECF subfamily)
MPADIATLLAEAPWLARLARSLTGDAAEADDIVQEAYAAALRSPPDDDRPLRPWLRRVVVNAIRMRHRGDVRRAGNEATVELKAEPVRTPAQLLERAQLERRVAELVLELDEPYRTTVLLRYREGLTAEAIAKDQGIPAGTVRSRLKTALDRMRRELDDRERTQMRAVFAPLVAAARPGPAPTLWRLVMAKSISKVIGVLGLLLLLLGGAVLVWQRASPAARRAGDAPQSTPARGAAHAIAPHETLFAQPGVAARRVRGRVTSDGAPYRGAHVQLVHATTELVVGETRTGADGTFDLGDRTADVYVVTASAPDRVSLPVQIDLRKPSSPPLELRLTGCSHLRGTIVDGSRAPIAHARVARADARAAFAESDVNGHYDLCTHFGSAWIHYAASGYQSVRTLLEVTGVTTRDVVLIPEATVEGRVVTLDDEPVAGAWIVIDPLDKGRTRNAPATVFSEPDGSFHLAGVAPGRNFIAAFAPGLRSTHAQEIVVGAGEARSGVVVRLGPAARISGVVVSGGSPVVGAGVGMRIGNRDLEGVLAVTQADGSFSIDRAPRGDVALYVENHTVIAPRSVHVGDVPTTVRIEVMPLGNVHGRVVRHGGPVADAQVGCPGGAVFSDATGSYECAGVDEGSHELFADASNGEWGRGTVTVKRGETATLDISLEFSAAICGQVIDERGGPVSGIDVHVSEQTNGDYGEDTTGADGRFCTRLLSGGTYDVAVYAGPRVLAPLPPVGAITLGPRETKQVTIAVPAPRLAIGGTVTDPDGAPVADAIVRLVAADAMGNPAFDEGVPSSRVLSDQNGHFSIGRLAAGDYTLIASARDGSEVVRTPITAGTHDVVVIVEPAGRIEGRLVGFTSPPTITAVLLSGTHVPYDMDVDGDRFRASGLSPGTYVLMALTDAHEADTRTVIVTPRQTANVTLTSRGTATVTGVVRDFRTRAPLPGARCNTAARDSDRIGAIYVGPDDGEVADERGVFRLTSTAGEIVIVCSGSNHRGLHPANAPRDRTTAFDVLAIAHTQNAGTIDARFDDLAPRIRELTKGGAADRAGLVAGDEVVEVDGMSVDGLSGQDVLPLITERPAGTPARLTIVRGSERRTVTVTVRSGT